MKSRPVPKQLENPNFEVLKNVCEKYMIEVAKYGGCDTDSDLDHYIYEEAIIALYGGSIWDFINKEEDDLEEKENLMIQ